MTSKEAMKILCGAERTGTIDDYKILVTPEDIRENLRSNDFELDLEFTQDLTGYDSEYDYEMFQGHSLSEVTF